MSLNPMTRKVTRASGAEKRNGRKAGIRAHQLGVADLAAGAGAGRHLIRRV
jgi:hypothetical protein